MRWIVIVAVIVAALAAYALDAYWHSLAAHASFLFWSVRAKWLDAKIGVIRRELERRRRLRE